MRTPDAAVLALRARALAGEKIPRLPLVYFGLTVPQRWALAGLPLVWGGYTWAAQDMGISELKNEVGRFNNLRFTLAAVTPAQRALAASDVEGAPVAVYMATVDPSTGVVAGAEQVFAGELDQPGWQDGPQALAHFTAEHAGNIALRYRGSRYTHDEQLRLYPGDTSLDVDPLTDAAPLVWPAQSFFKVPLE